MVSWIRLNRYRWINTKWSPQTRNTCKKHQICIKCKKGLVFTKYKVKNSLDEAKVYKWLKWNVLFYIHDQDAIFLISVVPSNWVYFSLLEKKQYALFQFFKMNLHMNSRQLCFGKLRQICQTRRRKPRILRMWRNSSGTLLHRSFKLKMKLCFSSLTFIFSI